MLELIKQPWPWYIAGPLIGLTVPALLILGNKSFGISSSLRHVCAACLPASISFFQYDWKKEIWNLVFVLGIFLGGIIAARFLNNTSAIILNENLVKDLAVYGITDFSSLVPVDIMSWKRLYDVQLDSTADFEFVISTNLKSTVRSARMKLF